MKLLYPYAVPIALSLTAYNAFLTGFIVLLKRRDEIGIRYFIASFVISIWGVGITFLLNNDLPASSSQSWGSFSQIIALWIPVTWLHFVLAFTERISKYKRLLRATYIITFLIFPFAFTKYFVVGFRPMVGFANYPIPGLAYHAFTSLFVFNFIVSFMIFFEAIVQSALEKKKDYQMVCFASLYGFVMGSLTLVVIYGIPLPQYNLLLMPVWQILLTYTMIRHKTFDAREIADAFQREKMTALGIMAASLNHEMRNPLYIAKGKIENYLMSNQDAVNPARNKADKVIYMVLHQIQRALDIMQRFSDFARPGSADKKEKVVWGEFFQEVTDLVSHAIYKKNIQLKTNFQKNLELKIHRRQFEEILVNLLINASQVLGEQGGIIEIKAFQGNGICHIEIYDNGPGISKEMQKKIFEPFFTTKAEKGMGLGLYITKQLVKRNGGKIEVESRTGSGTAFKLTFKA